MSSDRTPSFSGTFLTSPPPVSPDPAYIALTAASQIVNTDRADRGYLEGGANRVEFDTAIVVPGAVALVNGFLDQLLYSFLACSRSTSIAALRPAIQEVLKPRLAKEAIQGADEELEGYMTGGDAEELLAFHGGQSFRGDYDLNLIWRRTRLRCMVYTRLGDMEEEDEDTYLEQEEESANGGRRRLDREIGSISPAAAIFLTSVLEFIGEHAMLLAGEAAYNRFQTKGARSDNQRAVVEEVDMEKLAFNGTLGRLWRSWKKRVRSSSLLSPRPASLGRHKTSSLSDSASRNTSVSEGDEFGYFDHAQKATAIVIPPRKDKHSTPIPAQQAPGLPEEPDFSDVWAETSAPETADARQGRRRSMIEVPKHDSMTPTQTPSRVSQSDLLAPSGLEKRPVQARQRSSSAPIRQSPFESPVDEAFTTPRERPDPLERDHDRANAEKDLPRLTDDSANVSLPADDEMAVSTMYDGTISKSAEAAPEDVSHESDRGLIIHGESSRDTGEYDHELAPRALNFSGSSVHAEAPENRLTNGMLPKSRDSVVSSEPSFQGSQTDPAARAITSDRMRETTENRSEETEFPKRTGSLNHESDIGRSGHVGNLANLTVLQGHQLRTYDESGKAVKRDIPVLYEAPSNKDVIYNPDTNIRSSTGPPDETEVPTPTGAECQHLEPVPKVIPQEGVPTLTPLQELLEAARDTSDEASSNTASHGTPRTDPFVPAHRSKGSDSVKTDTLSATESNTSQPFTSVNKVTDPRAQPQSVATSTERAAVQRVSSASTPLTNGRTSTSSNREGRPMTASSTTSQMSTKIKGIIGRESGDLIRQPIPRRNSSDGSSSLVNSFQRTPRSADKEQDFEDLIKSDETVKYTLTPQNMREMEVCCVYTGTDDSSTDVFQTPESPRVQTHARSETQASLTGSLNGINGLRANPINVTEFAKGTSSFDTTRGPPQAPPKSPGVRSGRVVAPREPDAKDHNMRDFADFVRSTGPESVPTYMVRSASSGTLGTSKKERPSSSTSQAGPKKLTKAPSGTVPKQIYTSAPPKPEVAPKRTGSKLQAREAIVTSSNTTAELADFLRSGPDAMDGARGVQRSGAHIQPIMTSNNFVNGRQAVGSGTSVASTQGSFAPSKMTQSSTNSRTGLLDTTNRVQPSSPDAGRNNGVPSPRSIDLSQGRARKQRRVKDPYAIESDDENDRTQLPEEHEEESLSDFLRNYTPPPAVSTRPPPIGIIGAPKPAKQTVTLKERIQRNIAVIPDYRPLPPKAPKKPSSTKSPPQSNESRRKFPRHNSNNSNSSPLSSSSQPSANRSVSSSSKPPQLPPIDARTVSPHLVSQTGSKIDSYKPTQPTYAKHVERSRPKQHLQAREEHGVLSGPPQSGGLGDLADFLRETEPPPPSGPIGGGMGSLSPMKEKEEFSGFGRMFSRRKKEMR